MAKFDQDKTELFNSFYRAKVEDINDPENRGRVRIRVLGVHTQATTEDSMKEGIPISQLPFAEQAAPLFGGYSADNDNKSGVKSIPSVGSWVWCFFDNGNHNKPIIFASVLGNDDFETDEVGVADKADEVTTILTKSGLKIVIDDTSGSESLTVSADSVEIIWNKATSKFSIKTGTSDLKTILDSIQTRINNLVTPGNLLGNLGAPIVYTIAAAELTELTTLSTNIGNLLE